LLRHAWWHCLHLIEIIEFFKPLFRPASAHETILRADETIFRFRADIRKHRMVIDRTTKTAGNAGSKTTGDGQMRTLSFFLAFAFVLAGPSIAGALDGGLPGIGTFAYNGSPIATSTSQAVVVAVR
jgi:hypothetical protein